MIRRIAIIALLFAACIAHGQDWNTLGALWTEPIAASPASSVGGAVDLSGSEIFTTSDATLLNGSTAVSFSVWCKPATLNNGWFVRATPPSVGLYQQTGTRFRLYVNEGIAAGGGVPATNVWTHLMGSWSTNNAGRGILCVNGVIVNSNSVAGVCIQTNAFVLGVFAGVMDDLAIFRDRMLTTVDAAELYNSGTGKPVVSLSSGTNGLAGYWTFDDGLTDPNATNALDSVTGNRATGTSIGTGDWVTGKVPLP